MFDKSCLCCCWCVVSFFHSLPWFWLRLQILYFMCKSFHFGIRNYLIWTVFFFFVLFSHWNPKRVYIFFLFQHCYLCVNLRQPKCTLAGYRQNAKHKVPALAQCVFLCCLIVLHLLISFDGETNLKHATGDVSTYVAWNCCCSGNPSESDGSECA